MDADGTMAHNDHNPTARRSRQRICWSGWLTIAIAVSGLTLCGGESLAGESKDALANINQLLTAGKIGQAAQELRQLDDVMKSGQAATEVDLTFPLAITARGFEQANNLADAAEFYQRSVMASGRESAKQLPGQKLTLIRLAASSTLARAANYQAALDALEPLFDVPENVSDQQRKLLIQLCLHVGSESLSASQPAIAERAYDLASKHAPDQDRGTAMLGAGWAAAMQQSKPQAAAEKLAAFVEQFPTHDDAPRAAALVVTCLRQANLAAGADKALADLLDRWPESIAAAEAIARYNPDDQLLPAAATWLLQKATGSELQAFTPRVTALGLIAAADADHEAAWSALSQRLAATDSVGQQTSDVLQHLSDAKLNAHAQRLATLLIAPQEGTDAHAASREAACRWAGRNQLWSMLALASETSEPDSDDPTRTVAIERLFAESLMQTGRPDDSRKWWVHLVDQRKVDDFPTLLRCAETATSLADVDQASKRIEAARAASQDDPARTALVDMLSADLAVRQLRFDEARSILERVIQASQSVASLRGRAQWMIGETFFLQQKFSDAIEAYRRVEGIDPAGPWVEVALVQAGKSFEQLGRTREAAVCYSSLVSRFADSQHASVARRRLAAIAPTPSSPQSNSSSETIRR